MSILAFACAFWIVFNIFLAVFNVLAWPTSFKIKIPHTFGRFLGTICTLSCAWLTCCLSVEKQKTFVNYFELVDPVPDFHDGSFLVSQRCLYCSL